jgi:hypothetical protein
MICGHGEARTRPEAVSVVAATLRAPLAAQLGQGVDVAGVALQRAPGERRILADLGQRGDRVARLDHEHASETPAGTARPKRPKQDDPTFRRGRPSPRAIARKALREGYRAPRDPSGATCIIGVSPPPARERHGPNPA